MYTKIQKIKNLREPINTFVDWLGKIVYKLAFVLLVVAILGVVMRTSYQWEAERKVAQRAKDIQEACGEQGVTYRIQQFSIGGTPKVIFICDWSTK